MRRKLALWFVLLIAGFITGLILQYARLQRVQQELSASTKQLGSVSPANNCRSFATRRRTFRNTASLIQARADCEALTNAALGNSA
jgi:hypothetical protein